MEHIQDINWLNEQLPGTTENEKEFFIEKVSICVVNRMTEEYARRHCLKLIQDKRNARV